MENAGWLPLEHADLPALGAIAARLHPGLPERPEVFAEKLRLFPGGCLKFTAGGAMAGYGLAHPWALGAAPRLDSFLGALPETPGCLYVHDVAVLPGARGLGASVNFMGRMERLARDGGLGALALVSVYGTAPLWERFGFAAAPGPELASYGPGAVYMVKKL
jgi:GNAT superfamily N-acetyltransferase